jgi:hypothetical protein
MLVAPRSATIALQRQPRWVGAFVFLAAGWIATAGAIHPWSVAGTLDRLPASATQEARAAAAAALDAELPIRLAVLPLRLAAGWGAFALVLHFLCRAFAVGSPPTYLQVFALEVHAEAASLLGRVAGLVYCLITGAGSGLLVMPWSLGAIPFPGIDGIGRTLLGSLNLFTLWYVLVLAAGISVLCSHRPLKALLIVATAWCVSAGWSTAILTFLQHAFFLHP